MNNRITYNLLNNNSRGALSLRVSMVSLFIALLGFAFQAQAGEIDPVRSQALIAALATLQGDLLGGVIDSLAVRRDDSAVPALQSLAMAGTNDVTGKALLALGCIANEACVGTLRQRFKAAALSVREAAASGILLVAQHCQVSGDSKTARQLYDELLAAELPENLRVAAVHGAILAHGARDATFLVAHLRSPDQETRKAARLAAQSFPLRELALLLLAACDRSEDDAKIMLEETLQTLCSQPLIIGKRFAGWEGEIAKSFRREGDAIVGGNLEQAVPRNELVALRQAFVLLKIAVVSHCHAVCALEECAEVVGVGEAAAL
ncbi:MAG: hypothetical protein WC340_09095 [Kiritimatiellia bacterium]